MNEELGILKKLKPRNYWGHEARDLTTWLSQSANLKLSGDAIGLDDLRLLGTEQHVGEFRADIVARAGESDEQIIIIENQLERTDHSHLGQLLTYGSGLGSGLTATYIVWISPDFREEHRRALDWLNEVTDGSISFFGIRLELLQIDNSPLAPQFTLVSQPNEPAKLVKASAQKEKLTELQLRQFDFWSQLLDFCKDAGTFLSLGKPQPQHWFRIAIGKAEYGIYWTVSVKKQRIGCELNFRLDTQQRCQAAFDALLKDREIIESKLGPLVWESPDNVRRCRIVQYREANLEETDTWPQLFAWLKEKAESFHTVFSPLVKALEIPELAEEIDDH